MPRTKQTKEGSYVLPRVLEIEEIESVYRDLAKFARSSYSKFTLDAGQVALIDAAGMQLIVQFLIFMRGKDCVVDWVNDSIQIYQAALELGLDDQLEA
jgi:anti-anti-sigma regulatory factor